MYRYRWPYLLAAALFAVGIVPFLFSSLTIPSEAQAQNRDRPPFNHPAVPASQPTFGTARDRPSATTDPRTLTRPTLLATDARPRAVIQPDSPAHLAGDNSLPAMLDVQSLPPGVTVDLTYHVVMGWVGPGEAVDVTTPAGYGAAVADALGFFWTPIWIADGHPTAIVPGETVAIAIDGSPPVVITPPEISGGLDVLADEVSGAIAGDSGGTEVTLTMGVAQPPVAGAPVMTATTVADGSFTTTFVAADLGAESLIALDVSVDGVNVRSYLYPDPAVFLVHQYNRLAGYGPLGEPVHATVYANFPDDVRWEGGVTAQWPHGFYIFTDVEIVAGDVIQVQVGGATPAMTVIELGNLVFDAELDALHGTAPDGAGVRISMWQPHNEERLYYQGLETAGTGNQFDHTFTTDLRARDDVYVVVADASGNQVQLTSGPPFVSARDDLYSEWDCVSGRVDGPDLPLTVSLTTPEETFVRETGWSSDAGNLLAYCFAIRDPDGAWGPLEFSPGDTVTLSSPTWEGSVEIVDIAWQADTAADTISGEAPDGELEITLFQWNDWLYPLHGAATRVVVAASPYTAAFTGFDVRDGNDIALAHFDAATGFANQTRADWSRPTLPYFELYLPYGVGGQGRSPDELVTAVLYDENHTWLAETSEDHDDDPWRFWLGDFAGYWLEPGFWITLTSQSGWTAGMQIPHLAIDGDPESDLVTATGPPGLLYLDGGREDSGYGTFVPGPQAVLHTATFGHDLQWNDNMGLVYQAVDGNRARRNQWLSELPRVEFWLDPAGPDEMWGEAKPGTTVTITTPNTEVVVWADPVCGGCWHLAEPIEVNPGDTVTVVAGEGLFPAVITLPDPITAAADSDLDQVWGQIGGRAEDWVEIHGGWKDGYRETMTDAGGNYSVTYTDLPRAGQGYIRFVDERGDSQVIIHQSFQAPDLLLRVNYAHEWVEGNYEAGHAMWITLTDSLGNVKATASGETGPISWWGNQPGFSTNENVPWDGPQPDIQEGDWVYASLANGQTSTVRIGTIDGTLDLVNNTVAGTVSAPWFTGQQLDANCGIWEEGGPSMSFTVDADGGAYFCDFDALGWDLLPGQMVGVEYQEPDGDWVINIFEEPVPRLLIHKWANGQPAEGGNFIFRVEYVNEGGAPAEDVVIMDTLQGFAYLSDTSGLVPTTGTTPEGDPYVAWDLGNVAPGDWAGFDLFVSVEALSGAIVTNTAEIATSNPYNESEPWQMLYTWSGQVADNDTHLSVGKGAWTWNPAPGQDFVYNVNVCNNGSTASTEVTLTDTLPSSTTLVSWWAQEAGWQEVTSSDHQLVVERPSFDAWSCSEVYLRVHLDEAAWPGMELVNTAQVSAANDLETDDNESTVGHNVGVPYTDLAISQSWHWGTLVPGGHVRYGIHINNYGNLPVSGPIRVTDTLPAGTSFHGWHSWGWADISLVDVTGNQVIWEIDGLDNGYYIGVELALDITPDVIPGTLLVNQADIAIQPDEADLENNHSVWEEMVYGHGPNLRLRKEADWHGHGEGHNAWYRLEVENVGDETVHNVTVTDNYPAEMVLDGEPGVGYWQWWEWVDFPADHYFTVTLESLEPGWRVDIHYNTLIPGEEPVPFGLVLTNTADVMPVAGDTNPADNTASALLKTGPDLYVEKTLVEGVFLPGELVTYKLRFGNDQPGHAWWWNMVGTAWLTDTLPDGMSYVSAYQRWCGPEVPEWCAREPDEIDGKTLRWQDWFGAGHRNEILLTAQISENATGLDTLANWATISSDQPDVDIEPIYDNNASSHEAAIGLPHFNISKSYTSSRISGMLVTYGLTIENVGHATATDLVVVDEVPANVTYASGGAYDEGTNEVSWQVASLVAGASVEVQFTGQLGHSGQVINDNYRVAGSNEGVASEPGAAVSFAILPPTINANFSQSATAVALGESVTFTDASTTNGTPIVAWAWNFGDGQASTAQNPSHTYATAGVYDVTLQVTDSMGYTATHTETEAVTVYDLPQFDISKSYDSSRIAGMPVTYRLLVENVGNGTATGLVIVDQVPANVSYVSGGSYSAATNEVSWQVASLAAGSSVEVQFTGALGHSGQVVNDHYRVADSNEGVVGDWGAEVAFPILAPTINADFTQSATTVLTGEPVTFTDSSTTNGTPIVAWAWDFGNGQTSTAQDPTNTYTAPGVYTVRLTVTDAMGYTATRTRAEAVIVESGMSYLYLPMLQK